MIEVYSALCLKEPWLELILLGIKTLETRTKCLFKQRDVSVPFVLTSSKEIDENAWNEPNVGGLLGAMARERAIKGLGKLRALCDMGGFRLGVPGQDDVPARIWIKYENEKLRYVSEVKNVRRLIERPTRRVQVRDGKENIVAGASQGIFRVPKYMVELARSDV